MMTVATHVVTEIVQTMTLAEMEIFTEVVVVGLAHALGLPTDIIDHVANDAIETNEKVVNQEILVALAKTNAVEVEALRLQNQLEKVLLLSQKMSVIVVPYLCSNLLLV
jgi:hypothetical protein